MSTAPLDADSSEGEFAELSLRDARDLLVNRLTSAQFARVAPASAPIHHEVGEREVRATVVETVRLLFGGLGLDWECPTPECLVAVIRHLAANPHEWGLADPEAAEHFAGILDIADGLERTSLDWEN